jgi:hypothetical protein
MASVEERERASCGLDRVMERRSMDWFRYAFSESRAWM